MRDLQCYDDNYEDYLKSEHWLEVREEALERAEYKCILCSATNKLEVHHNNYDCLWCEEPSDLAVLCSVCHRRHHKAAIKRIKKRGESAPELIRIIRRFQEGASVRTAPFLSGRSELEIF